MVKTKRDLFIKYIALSSFGSDFNWDQAGKYFYAGAILKALNKLALCGEDVKQFIDYSLFGLKFEERYNTLMKHFMVKELSANEVSYLMCCDDFIKGLVSVHPETYHIFKGNKEIYTQTNINPIRKYQFTLDLAEAIEKDKFYKPEMFAKYISYVNHGRDYSAILANEFFERKCIKTLNKLESFGIDTKKFIKDTFDGENSKMRFDQLMFNVDIEKLSVKDLKFVMPYDDYVAGLVEKYPETAHNFNDRTKVAECEYVDIDKMFKDSAKIANEAQLYRTYNKAYNNNVDSKVQQIDDGNDGVELKTFDDFTNI